MRLQYAPRPARASQAPQNQNDVVVSIRSWFYARVANTIVTRSDAPLVRNLRRGTTADVLAALRDAGVVAFVEDLLKYRYARSAVTSTASFLKTWAHFQEEAFGRNSNDISGGETM